jgi:hypothetical protein
MAAFWTLAFRKDHAVRAFRDVAWDRNGIVKVWVSCDAGNGLIGVGFGLPSFYICSYSNLLLSLSHHDLFSIQNLQPSQSCAYV